MAGVEDEKTRPCSRLATSHYKFFGPRTESADDAISTYGHFTSMDDIPVGKATICLHLYIRQRIRDSNPTKVSTVLQ